MLFFSHPLSFWVFSFLYYIAYNCCSLFALIFLTLSRSEEAKEQRSKNKFSWPPCVIFFIASGTELNHKRLIAKTSFKLYSEYEEPCLPLTAPVDNRVGFYEVTLQFVWFLFLRFPSFLVLQFVCSLRKFSVTSYSCFWLFFSTTHKLSIAASKWVTVIVALRFHWSKAFLLVVKSFIHDKKFKVSRGGKKRAVSAAAVVTGNCQTAASGNKWGAIGKVPNRVQRFATCAAAVHLCCLY